MFFIRRSNCTEWGNISSLHSVGHCEGRGGRRRVGLGSKGAGSWEVPVTTLHSRKDGVVHEQRAFVVETYFSQSHSIVAVQRAFRTRYQIPPRDRVPDRKSILLWVENFRETGSVSEKKMRTTTDLSEHQRTSRLSDGPFYSLPGALHANTTQTTATTCKIFFLRLFDLKLSML